MGHTNETRETGPWTVRRVLERLDNLHPLGAKDAHQALRSEENLAAALREALHTRGGNSKVTAAALLLMLQDEAGRDPFLAALKGEDNERDLAVAFLEYCVTPKDIMCPPLTSVQCLESDELFEGLRRDLHEPWSGLSLRVLKLVSQQDYPQARSITRSFLTHRDPSLRRSIAWSYLRAGRDEGAFAVIEDFLRSAPAYVHHRDPGWYDFYGVKQLWYCVEQAAERGDAELKQRAASLTMKLVSEALDARDCERRFDVNDGLIAAPTASKVLAAVMPAGAQQLLERMINCDSLSEFYRGEALKAYAQALGDKARPMISSALQDEGLRKDAAQAMTLFVKANPDPMDIAALSNALSRELRPDVVSALAKALVEAGPDARAAIEAALERSEPWTRVELAWRIHGGTDREFADLLTEAGVMDPITGEQLTEALCKGFDVRSLIWAGGERLVVFSVKSSTDLEHFDLFQDLIKAARPNIAIEDLKEAIDFDVVREPVPGSPRVEKVTDRGTVCTVSFTYQGRAFSFDAYPQGRWHDVPAVMKGFDDFMHAIGREDRCYELEGGGEWALFAVAPASKFEPLAARLRIPLERDSASARDAAKAYQRQIQNM